MLRHRWSLLSLCLTSGVLVATAPAAASAAGPLIATPLIATSPSCSSSFDLYAYTRTALATCGIKTYPLTSVVPAPDGGEDYQYDLPDGSVEHEYVLPKGFDAATASPALRADYGIMPLPPAGSSPDEVVVWARSMQHLTFDPPTPYFATSDTTAPALSANSPGNGDSYTEYNWAGYSLCAAEGSTYRNDCYDDIFTSAAGLYSEPNYDNSNSGCRNDSVGGTPEPPADLIWAGVGGVDDPTFLAQTGTAYNRGAGVKNHGAWYETVPGKGILPYPQQSEFQANPGDAIVPIVDYVSGTYYFEVYDETTGKTAVKSLPGAYSGESTEMVVERPAFTIGKTNYFTALGDFTSPIQFASESNGIWLNSYPANGWRWGLHMEEKSTNQDLADPSTISAPNGNFSVTYKNCGGVEAYSTNG